MNWTDKPPTTPGDFKWKRFGEQDHEAILRPIRRDDDDPNGPLFDAESGVTVAHLGGLWLRLVPAEEVEKAFRDGYGEGYCCGNSECSLVPERDLQEGWLQSEARKVAEGEAE